MYEYGQMCQADMWSHCHNAQEYFLKKKKKEMKEIVIQTNKTVNFLPFVHLVPN